VQHVRYANEWVKRLVERGGPEATFQVVRSVSQANAAMRQVAATARKHGKAAGFMATDAAWIARAREMGYSMIAGGTDTGLLETALKGMVGQIEGKPR